VLSAEDNELIARTGPTTPLGNMYRRYWHAICLASELPAPDCDPIEVVLLGEELVAFRNSKGEVGLLDARCPHRGTSLCLGRNEENGLRCINHGWKFDITGACVDMPAEAVDSPLRRKARVRSFPCVEKAGIVWAYVGPPAHKPEFPQFIWTMLPAEHLFVSKWLQQSNFFNAIDGATDSHIAILHSFVDPNVLASARGERLAGLLSGDKRTAVFAKETDVGLMVASRRNAQDPNAYFWRITQFFFPYFIQTASEGHCNFWVPIDDESCWSYTVSWRLDRPFTDEEKKQMGTTGIHVRNTIPGTFVPKANRANRWLQDREKQRTYNYSGIDQIPLQDAAVQCTTRAARDGTTITDRTKEYLGPNDVGTIMVRSKFLRAIKAFVVDGTSPPGVDIPRSYLRRGSQVVLPRDASWEEWAAENLTPEKTNTNVGSEWQQYNLV
jgi:phthalate 4,5-dioxygenase oxygenase subunit